MDVSNSISFRHCVRDSETTTNPFSFKCLENTCYYQLDRLTQDKLVDLPVLEVLLEDEGAHVRVEVEHAGAVDVQDGVEAVPVPVEEELCLYQVTSSNTAISKINI